MTQKTLPAKYYLSHARELFGFVNEQCACLLTEEHSDYLAAYERLSEDAQCMLVRFLSRKPHFLARDSLQYAEIDNPSRRLEELQAAGFISTPSIEDWPRFATALTKAMLLDCLNRSTIKVKRTTPKTELVQLVLAHVDPADSQLAPLRNAFLIRRKQRVIDYIMFLFFGDLRNRFQKFAMRDLGVLKTRKSKATLVARFSCREEAISGFILHSRRRDFLFRPSELREETASYLLSCTAQGAVALEERDKLLLEVGNAFVDDQPEYAIRLWRASNDPAAIERWVRESYKHMDREALQTELEELRNQEMPAISKVFLEDFYVRKYQGKRTSIFTDMLRERSNKMRIDDAYMNDVEQGVIDHYRRQGIDSWFTENRFWRALFAFTFWQLLFNNSQKQHSEFDRLPAVLRTRQFYTDQQAAIEQALQLLDDRDAAKRTFIRLASRHYGYPTGIFRWRADLLDSILPSLE
ncbi:MAG: hypothetical protein KJP04_03315, partial [Arenicella sp.]|nr:hypothetical protein [Arenicella sp.]